MRVGKGMETGLIQQKQTKGAVEERLSFRFDQRGRQSLLARVRMFSNAVRPVLLGALLVLPLLAGCVGLVPSSVKKFGGIEYAKVGSTSLKLDIYSPKSAEGKLPALVWIHGGSWLEGSKDPCPIAFMATQHLAIVSINYRLSGEAKFPAQIYDCKGAVRWLRANAEKYHLDPDHIGIFGASAGGHLAALLGTTADDPRYEGDVGGNKTFSSRVQAVCAFYPPVDLTKLTTDPFYLKSSKSDLAKLFGGPLENNMDKARMASPINCVTKDSAPFYLLHGDKDKWVPLTQSEEFYRALKAAGVEATLAVVKGGGHGIIATPKFAEEIYRFYQKHLGNR